MATIALARGVPAPECLPVEELADCARAAVERDGRTVLSYGPGGGYTPLREWLAERHGARARGRRPGPRPAAPPRAARRAPRRPPAARRPPPRPPAALPPPPPPPRPPPAAPRRAPPPPPPAEAPASKEHTSTLHSFF